MPPQGELQRSDRDRARQDPDRLDGGEQVGDPALDEGDAVPTMSAGSVQ
ncbi:hypothetical protein BJ973_000092 [Actinoplanes tereljensis]|uniref:Uncharacterized protein n=1 Tax=Paractinoplanes tereljensis TaxID=571912 RepID=A0A919P0T6_9ACTN|nr:hypothetical protein [Actinoplanes tereljensis]GIF26817.1 hypothetical protein Ate02nite_95470 [Actinoplanes tereljensis]